MTRRPPLDLADLEASIGYQFTDRELLTRALTHITALPGTPTNGPHYQRLEFLGDRVLGVVIADMLFRTFPLENEGDLSRRLADLVRMESCADIAELWGVSPYIRLGARERFVGMRKQVALLGDVCEALIASVYLDGGIEAARVLIERSFGPKLLASKRSPRDPKSALQEWAMRKGLPFPVYREVRRKGPDHAPIFVIAVEIQDYPPEKAEGATKKSAEQAAATAFLRREGFEEST